MKLRPTVIIVDYVDIDNVLAVLAALRKTMGLNVVAVIVSGRWAHPDRSAPITEHDPEYSLEVLRRNTRRMKGSLTRAGYGHILVFEGLIPAATVVPHWVHVDEVLLDLFNDNEYMRADGDLSDAAALLATLDVFDVVVGGPMTELAALLRRPELAGRFGRLTCQLGMFELRDEVKATMAGGRKQANVAFDTSEARFVLENYPGPMHLVPTDVTKLPSVGFDHPDDLLALGLSPELWAQYVIFWTRALRPRDEGLYPHDVHPVFLLAQLRGVLHQSLYRWEPADNFRVTGEGEVYADLGLTNPMRPRFIATNVRPTLFRSLLRQTFHAAA